MGDEPSLARPEQPSTTSGATPYLVATFQARGDRPGANGRSGLIGAAVGCVRRGGSCHSRWSVRATRERTFRWSGGSGLVRVSQRLVGLQGGDLLTKLDLVVGDAGAGSSLRVEEILEVGMLVGQLVSLHSSFLREADDVELARRAQRCPANNRCMAAVMARRSSSSVNVGLLAAGDAGSLMLLDERVQVGYALTEAFTQRHRGGRLDDFFAEPGDLAAQCSDVGVGARDVRAGRIAPVDRGGFRPAGWVGAVGAAERFGWIVVAGEERFPGCRRRGIGGRRAVRSPDWVSGTCPRIGAVLRWRR